MHMKSKILINLSCVLISSALYISPKNEKLDTCAQLDKSVGTVFDDKTMQLYLGQNRKVTSNVGCPAAQFLEPIRSRMDLGKVLDGLNLKGVGVEVGVQRGLFTQRLLEHWKRGHAYIQVDLWKHQQNYKDIANVNDSKQADFQQESCSRGLQAVKKKQTGMLVQCQNYSTSCAKYFPDNSLDFVYLDARHDRKGVLEDLKTYWPKVRPGGVMAGHDYTTQSEPDGVPDPTRTGQKWTLNYDGTKDESKRVVKGAVDDFFSGTEETPADLKRCPRQVVISYHEQGWNTWMVSK